MKLTDNSYLSYCTNVHPGESWEEVFDSLKQYVVDIKKSLVQSSFAIGLRLSNKASIELLTENNLEKFNDWLTHQNIIVSTINGFPYGDFHSKSVKDMVHFPDWTHDDRLEYTKRLFTILSRLNLNITDIGVSTSPISYRFWHQGHQEIESVKLKSCAQIMMLVFFLNHLSKDNGVVFHLDIEPEPDGILETSAEFIDYYNDYLINIGGGILKEEYGISLSDARKMIYKHIRICFDVCHFSVGFENMRSVFEALEKNKIKVGRIQISSAISSGDQRSIFDFNLTKSKLNQFIEPTYLHQTVVRQADHSLTRYRDLDDALSLLSEDDVLEIRTHYHVPIFDNNFEQLKSTQHDIETVLDYWVKHKVTQHLEIETYTWHILPKFLQKDIVTSIVREFNRVLNFLHEKSSCN